MWRTLSTAIISALALVGCQEDLYTIDAPDNLQEQIDAIAKINAEKEAAALAAKKSKEDPYQVGTTDNASGYFGECSRYYTVGVNDTLIIEFTNYSPCTANYNNWCLPITNDVNVGEDGYVEYYILRADRWDNIGGDQTVYTGSMASLEDGIGWDAWKDAMDGAKVSVMVYRDKSELYFESTTTNKEGTFTMNTQSTGAKFADVDKVRVMLSVDHSHLQVTYVNKVGGEDPTKTVTREIVTGDQTPTSIEVSNTPKAIVIGETDFWGAATASVTFSDGSVAQVDTANVNFIIIPDLTTPGVKTIVLTYSLTKLGNPCEPVSTYYTLEVTNKVVSFEISNPLTYYLYKYTGETLPIYGYANGYNAIYTDNSKASLLSTNVAVTETTVPATLGEHEINMTYLKDETITGKGSVVVAQSADAQTNIGAPDFTNGWWSTFSDHDVKIAPNTAYATSFVCKSDNLANYHSPCYILRSAEDPAKEYAVTRTDHFGWGDGYGIAIGESNWNWDTFAGNINNSKYDVVIVNNGNDTADILVSVTYENGEKHFQNYRGITVNSADLAFAFVAEESYLVWE